MEYENGLAMFTGAVERAAELAAIHYFETTLTFGELDWMSDALAVALSGLGVSPVSIARRDRRSVRHPFITANRCNPRP